MAFKKKPQTVDDRVAVSAGQRCDVCKIHDLAICGPLKGEPLKKFAQGQSHHNYQIGDIIFEEGQKRNHVYTLISGSVRMLKILEDGRRCVTDFVIAGEFIGMIDHENYVLTAEAITPVTACVVGFDHINDYFRNEPLMRARLLAMTRTALYRCYNNQLILGRLSPVEKLARFLYELHKRMKMQNLSVDPLKLDMNRTDIADHLGLTVETVSRCFSKLKMQNIIYLMSANVVKIINLEKLKAQAIVVKEVD